MQQRNKKELLPASLIIRKILAACLVLVFAFGIAPKRAMHNMLAGHTDARYVKHDHPGACVSNAVFNCQCDNFVAESPFVAAHLFSEPGLACYFSGSTGQPVSSVYSFELFAHSLRGPPAC